MRSALLAAAIAIAGGAASTGGAAAQTPGPAAGKPGEADRWVAQLGADDYHARARAQEALILLGEAARPAATVALKHDSLEVRSRAARVIATLDLLAAEERRQQLERDLNRFVAGELSGDEAKLPTWPRFRKTIGEDQPSRELFAAMVRAETGLLQMAAENPAGSSAILKRRIRGLYQLRNTTRIGEELLPSTTAIFWLSTENGIELSTNDLQLLYALSYESFRNRIADAKSGPAIRKLVGAWVAFDHSSGDENIDLYKLTFASGFNLDEGIVVARRVLSRPNSTPSPHVAQLAATVVGNLGREDDLPVLENLLANQAVLRTMTTRGGRLEIRVSDVALETMLRMTNQNPDDYFNANTDGRPFGTRNFRGFPVNQPQLREEAIQKWKLWSAGRQRGAKKPTAGAHQPPEPPGPPQR